MQLNGSLATHNFQRGSFETDMLAERMLREPMPDGIGKGQVVDLDAMLDRYYELRGWDRKTGIPKREKLAELGFDIWRTKNFLFRIGSIG